MPELPPTRGDPPRPKTPRASKVAVLGAESGGGDMPVKHGGRRDTLLVGSMIANGILCLVVLVLGIALVDRPDSSTDWPDWWVRARVRLAARLGLRACRLPSAGVPS